MPTENQRPTATRAGIQTTPTVTRAGMQITPTAAGFAVIAMAVAALFMSSSSRLAVGFLIPLAAAIVIDLFVSRHVVDRRRVTITPVRTVAHLPAGIPVRIEAPHARHPVRLTLVTLMAGEQVVNLAADVLTTELIGSRPSVTNFVRCETSCTVLGLGTARRWEVHTLPLLHWAPEPEARAVAAPEAIDEAARLRTYVPGDRLSRVSWPVTARTGQMHVRAAGHGYDEFVIAVNLDRFEGELGEEAILSPAELGQGLAIAHVEATLRLVATLVTQLLEDGHQVRLLTTELDPDHFDELRAEARANPRLPTVFGSRDLRKVTVDRFVTDEDDLARRLALAELGSPIGWSYGSFVEVSPLGIRVHA